MIPSMHYLDRYRNEETRTYSEHADYTEAEAKYRPGTAGEGFYLPTYLVDKKDLLIYKANPSNTLEKHYLPDDRALFCVHPQMLTHFPDEPYIKQLKNIAVAGPDIFVTPTSSTRTLLTNDPDLHALKVHFPFRISRYTRKMRNEVIEQAVAVSADIENGIHYFDERFAMLREVIGMAFHPLDNETDRGENWGYLIRDMHPFPLIDQKRHLVPGFSLYGKDFFKPENEPLIFDLIGENDPLDVVLNDIMLPIITHWITCFQHFGYMLEPHGQNVLLEIDAGRKIKRIVHRDLSTGIDMRKRADLKLSSDHLNNYNRMDYGQFNSIAYDMFMGNHFFDRIVDCCREKYPHLSVEDFRAPCRDLFATLFPDHAVYFPATVQYFSEKRDKYNKPLYLDTTRKPDWRP